MSIDFSLTAKARDDQGKGASRRLRHRANLVPAVLYGAGKPPQNLAIAHKDLVKALEHEAFYTHIIQLDVDGQNEDVLLKDLQRHPSKPLILHADFMRIDRTRKVILRVPLHFINEAVCVGVKAGGGVINHQITDLEIRCLPSDIPEYIEVDMANVKLGEIVHISSIQLPAGVESVQLSHGADHDLAVASVNAPKAEKVEEPVATAAAETPAAGDAPAATAVPAKKEK